MDPILNILIRTSNRPEKFQRLVENIRNQSFKNVRLIVSCDRKEDVEYVAPLLKEGKDLYIDVDPVATKEFAKGSPTFYNLYCNTLALFASEGWIIYIDDDDLYIGEALEEIVELLRENKFNPANLYMWKMQNLSGRVHPSTLRVALCDCGTPMFCVHSAHKELIQFTADQCGDGLNIIKLAKNLRGVKWLDKVLVKVEGPDVRT